MSGWGCPHELMGRCQRVTGRGCDPGMKGCVLFGRFRWSNEAKNRSTRRLKQSDTRNPVGTTGNRRERDMNTVSTIRVKRVYEPHDKQDGFRVLVDRIWPRGLSRNAAALDQWMKEIAPSAKLRKWFRHDSAKWERFCARYAGELDQKPEKLAFLRTCIAKGTVTLVYAAKDNVYNNAVALKRYLESC